MRCDGRVFATDCWECGKSRFRSKGENKFIDMDIIHIFFTIIVATFRLTAGEGGVGGLGRLGLVWLN